MSRREGAGWLRRVLVGPLAAAVAFSTACYDDEPTALDAEILQLRAMADGVVPADGETVVSIVATVPKKARSEFRTITFSTTKTTFLETGKTEAELTVDTLGQATAHLVTPRSAGTATVEGSVDTHARRVEVVFARAYPDTVLVETTPFTLNARVGEEITVTAVLRRSVGQVSPGLAVRFSASREDGSSFGRFGVASLSDDDGRSTVRLAIIDTTYRGTVRVEAAADSAGVEVVKGEALLEITDP